LYSNKKLISNFQNNNNNYYYYYSLLQIDASEYNDFKHVLEIINTRIFLFEAFSSRLPLQ